ncbi:hypothetical protein FRB95_007948 [Tulasnella sp. JGI-2019a]|nr:hypothetical protein FRB95_007948 [Tulasnella sp. JGI-2019a]
MSLSAADLQKRHALEGAPDPFPSLGEQDTNSSKVNGASSSEHKHRAGSNKQVAKPVSLDTSSEAAFPSLGSAKTPTAASSGGWSDVSRIKRAAVKTYGFTDSLDLGDIDLRTAGKDGKPTTLGDVMKTVISKTGMIIESSTQRKTGMTTFLIKGDSSHDAAKAKNLLTAMLSSRVTRVIDAPESVLGAIVGTKGATITQFRETHQVKIELPPRKDPASNGTAAQLPNNEDDEEDEPTAQITVTGPAPLVESAIVDLKAIIGTRAKKVTRRIKDVPEHVLPFVASDIPSIEAKVLEAHPEAMISITSSREDKEFSLYGDKVAVLAAMDQLQEAIEAWKPRLSSVTVTIPRSQHRFVLGGYGPEELFEESQVVVLAPQQGEGLALWGESAKLGAALGVVLQKASSQHVTSYDLPGKAEHAKQAHAYLVHTSYLDNIAYAHPDVTVHVTPDEEVERTGKISLDFVGDAAKVAPAVSEVKALMKKLDGGLKGIEVDWLVTKFLVSRHDQKIKQFQEEHNVIVFFQPEEMESSSVILVHDPEKSPAGISASQKQKHLKEVADHILKLASEAPAVKSETMHVDKKWHSAVLGKTDEVIGEGGSLSIKVGSQANLGVGKEPPADDDILIRGPVSEVDRAVKEIAKIVEDAKIDEIETSYNIEFTIPRDYVGRIVGSQGAGVNKLRDTLNVRVDFDDEADDTKGEWAEKGKGKKGAAKNSKVKITGCKQNADEAKKRILDLVDKYADETSETLRIPHQYHSGLIGASGKYVTRLEDKYGVKITYGREQNDESYGTGPKGRENLKADEVLIKGGRKGVAGAKAELLEAAEFEKSNNLSVTFNVPTRSISRIVGKGGASINDIKNQTGAQIDIDRAEDSSAGTSTITVRGDAGATKDAKAAILAVAAGFGDEIEETIYIESKYHRNFIGKGGETLRELITKVGGPTDPKQQAGLVHFPRQGESPDEVHLRGDKSLVNKLKKELETMAATFRDRVVMGVGVPAAQHRTLIGRGGQHLNDLQSKTSTQIWFPGSRAYGSVGDPENISALNDVVPEDLVKVFGSKAACEAAIAELSKAPVAPAQRAPRPTAQEQLARTISVPLKYHNVIHQQGNFFRNIRSLGVFLDQSQIPEVSYTPTRPAPTPVVAAISSRIDDVDEEPETASTDGVEWQVIPNYQDAPEGDAEWVLRAREEEALDSAERMLRMAIEHAESASHVGFLTVADRSAFPRIVGTKGANVSRIRAETGADVTVGKSDNTIVIIGSEDAIELAKAAILQTVQGGKGPRRSD